MEGSKSYQCKECGETFEKPVDLARHRKAEKAAERADTLNTTEGGGVKAGRESFLTPEDRDELREQEMSIKRLELSVRQAKLESELARYRGSSEPPKEKTWVLPDGTTFQGSSADYKDLLQIYYTTETARNKASQKVQNTGDDPTIKLLLEQNTKMKEQIDNKWKTDMENKLNYALNKDPVDESITGWDKVEKLASKYGYIRGDPKSDMIKSKFDLQATAVTKSLDTVSKKIDQSMKRADKLTDTLAPVIREFAGITLQKYKNEHGIAGGDIVPVPDENLINLEKSFVDGEDEDSERNSPYDVREFLERKIRNEKQGKKDK